MQNDDNERLHLYGLWLLFS